MRNPKTLWTYLVTLGVFLFQPIVKAQPGKGEAAAPTAPPQGPVQLSPAQRRIIGVTYGTVAKRPLIKVIRTVGRVEYDERRLSEVTLKIAGWIQDLFVDYTGKRVEKGQPLLTLYSPDLVSAQEEYLLALRTREELKDSRVPRALESAESLVKVSRNRLLLWDLMPGQIRDLERLASLSSIRPSTPLSAVLSLK